jgi:glycosyltransferase involved in cell wall biosynthesis
MSDLVSIIVPCYNQAQYLDEALQSVIFQSYTNWECIIIDDGSTDHVCEIANKWIKKDARFQFIHSENKGVCSARNTAIEKANGKYILPLDADDKISKEYLTLAIKSLEKDKTLKLVYCMAQKFGAENERWILPSFSLNNLAKDNMIFCTAIYYKHDWELLNGYDCNMVKGLEDWEFWIALLKNGGSVLCLEHVGFYYRIKDNSRQHNLTPLDKKPLFEYISIKHSDFFVAQLGSFIHLQNEIRIEQMKNYKKVKNKKIAIDIFCKTIFGFTIFGTLRNNRLV